MFPDGCTLPGSTQQRILVVLLKTSQTGVQHFWKRHVRLGGIGLPSIMGFHREDIHGNCVRAEVPPDLLESADIGVPGAKARLANLRRKPIMREKRLSNLLNASRFSASL